MVCLDNMAGIPLPVYMGTHDDDQESAMTRCVSTHKVFVKNTFLNVQEPAQQQIPPKRYPTAPPLASSETIGGDDACEYFSDTDDEFADGPTVSESNGTLACPQRPLDAGVQRDDDTAQAVHDTAQAVQHFKVIVRKTFIDVGVADPQPLDLRVKTYPSAFPDEGSSEKCRETALDFSQSNAPPAVFTVGGGSDKPKATDSTAPAAPWMTGAMATLTLAGSNDSKSHDVEKMEKPQAKADVATLQKKLADKFEQMSNIPSRDNTLTGNAAPRYRGRADSSDGIPDVDNMLQPSFPRPEFPVPQDGTLASPTPPMDAGELELPACLHRAFLEESGCYEVRWEIPVKKLSGGLPQLASPGTVNLWLDGKPVPFMTTLNPAAPNFQKSGGRGQPHLKCMAASGMAPTANVRFCFSIGTQQPCHAIEHDFSRNNVGKPAGTTWDFLSAQHKGVVILTLKVMP